MNKTFSPSSPSGRTHNRASWRGLSVLLLAGFVTIFDLFVVNVGIPEIQAEFGMSFASIGFIVAGYELAFAALLITGGRLGDLFGRRRLFMAGMAGFTVSSALCGLAPGAGFLVGSRVLQGLAAALLFPQVYASIRVTFSGGDRHRAFGLLGMTLGLAAIAGQVLGGWLVQADIFGWGWRNIFLINVPVGAIAIAAARWIPESRAPQRSSLDWPGVFLSSGGLVFFLVPLIEGPGQGWPAWSLWLLGGAVVFLTLFYRQQEQRRRAGSQPLVDMRLLTRRRFALGAVLVLLIYSTSSSFFLCFALLVQTGMGVTPFVAGSIFAPCSAGFVLASLSAPRLVARWGAGVIVAGSLIYAFSVGMLIVQVWTAGAELVPVRLIPVLTVVGFGQGFVMTPLVNLVLGFVDEAQAGMASGIISTAQQIGAASGVALSGILFSGALVTDVGAISQTGRYVNAFVSGMLYNLVAAGMVCLLLSVLVKMQRLTD